MGIWLNGGFDWKEPIVRKTLWCVSVYTVNMGREKSWGRAAEKLISYDPQMQRSVSWVERESQRKPVRWISNPFLSHLMGLEVCFQDFRVVWIWKPYKGREGCGWWGEALSGNWTVQSCTPERKHRAVRLRQSQVKPRIRLVLSCKRLFHQIACKSHKAAQSTTIKVKRDNVRYMFSSNLTRKKSVIYSFLTRGANLPPPPPPAPTA